MAAVPQPLAEEMVDRDAGDPFTLIVPKGSASDNAIRLLYRLRAVFDYGVVKEHESESQTVYLITPRFFTEEDA